MNAQYLWNIYICQGQWTETSANLFQETWSLLRAEGRHFGHLLWWWVLINNFFTLIMHIHVYNVHINHQYRLFSREVMAKVPANRPMVRELGNFVFWERFCHLLHPFQSHTLTGVMRLKNCAKHLFFCQFLLPVSGAEVTDVKIIKCFHILFTGCLLFKPQN
jgi:hypothetical protein